MRVDIERIEAALAVIAEFNQLDLAAVQFYEHGEPVVVLPETLDRFRLAGLANKDFVDFRAWEPGFMDVAEPA